MILLKRNHRCPRPSVTILPSTKTNHRQRKTNGIRHTSRRQCGRYWQMLTRHCYSLRRSCGCGRLSWR